MFFITCFENIDDRYGFPDMGACATFGFMETLEEAEQALNNNKCDMREVSFEYAIVEEMHPGIHPDASNRWFFKWDNKKEGFFRIDEPPIFEHLCNIALG